MQIDNCIILAAGFGTRMGSIGKNLPKVLWPVFERSLLELQVEYAKSLGAKKIFINLHHQKDLILSFVKNKSVFEDVEFLIEDEILDIGGGIHNLARKVNYRGNLLVLNADQFFLMSKEFVENAVNELKSNDVLLFTYQVDPRQGYNCLNVENNILKSITPADQLTNTEVGLTYTGNSLINLNALKPVEGKSSFFDSVADFRSKNILTKNVGNLDYWDFGTAQRYWNSIKLILTTYKKQATHPFVRFLINNRAIKSWKIDLNTYSYHSNGQQVVNLDLEQDVSHSSNLIIISGKILGAQKGPMIIREGMEEKINL